jgi:hypothetical protein
LRVIPETLVESIPRFIEKLVDTELMDNLIVALGRGCRRDSRTGKDEHQQHDRGSRDA